MWPRNGKVKVLIKKKNGKIDFKSPRPKWPKVYKIDKVDNRNKFLKGYKYFYQIEVVKKEPWAYKLYKTEFWTVFYDFDKTER